MGYGNKDGKTAGNTPASADDIPIPPEGVRCDRCRRAGILPVAYMTTDGIPAIGQAMCHCDWGRFYYAVFASQGMMPTDYDNWETALTSSREYHEVNAHAKTTYHQLRKSRGMPYRGEDGNWIDPEEEPTEPKEEFDEDLIPE